MALIRGRRKALSLKHMAQMPTAVGADDLGALHAEGAVDAALDRARHGVEKRRPPAPRLELGVGLVQRRVARRAVVRARARVVLVVRARVRRFGARGAQHSELLGCQHCLPLFFALLHRVVARHFGGCAGGRAE